MQIDFSTLLNLNGGLVANDDCIVMQANVAVMENSASLWTSRSARMPSGMTHLAIQGTATAPLP
jgi:hypothetical protein